MAKPFAVRFLNSDKMTRRLKRAISAASSKSANELTKTMIAVVAREIMADTPIKARDIKSAIKVKKATRRNPISLVDFTGSRLNLGAFKPKVIREGTNKTNRRKRKVGVEVIGLGNAKQRIDRAFIIKVGPKKLVYVRPKGSDTIHAARGSSIPHLAGTVGIEAGKRAIRNKAGAVYARNLAFFRKRFKV